MAYYSKAPNQKRPAHRPQDEKWEEEGTRYNKGKTARGNDERRGDRYAPKRADARPSRPDDRPPRGPRPEGRPGFRGPRPEGKPPFRGPRPEGKPDFHRPDDRPARSYKDFEHSREPIYEDAQAEPNENILSGRNPIREALKSGRDIEKILVMKGELSGSARQLVQMAKEAHIPVQEVEKSRLDAIAPNHQGMIAFASAYAYATVEEMLEDASEKEEAPFLVILDGVTDPHNLGAVIRTAECVGAHGVIVRERRGVGLTPAAVKASAGAVEHVKVARVTNLNRLIEDLKRRDIWIYGLSMEGDDYESVDFSGGVALVVGSEGSGISRLTEEICDCKVSLPMRGKLDSLNASVAAGVVMYRVLASRKA